MGMIYLASPIDFNPDKRGLDMLDLAATEIKAAGLTAFNPATAYIVGERIDSHGIHQANAGALEVAKGLLAILPGGVVSIGVPMEIQHALDRGIPVVVLGGGGSVPLKGSALRQFPYHLDGLQSAVKWLRDEMEHEERSVWNNDYHYLHWTGDQECAPRRGTYEGDAGYDLVVSEDVTIRSGSFVDIDLGVSVQLAHGTWGRITGRSSTLRKKNLLVNEGIIDNGYRGPLYAAVWNLGNLDMEVKRGERIAQLLIHKLEQPELKYVEALALSDRGVNAFGSTGS